MPAETTFPTSESNPTASTLRRNGEGMVDRLAQTAHSTIDRVAGAAGPALDRMRDTASQTAESMQQRWGEIGESGSRMTETARDYVRERPLTAIAIAMLAGMVIARWIR